MQYQCPSGPDGTPGPVIDLNSVGGTGNIQSQFPNLNARRLNLCMADVMQTIQEGRAEGNIKLFNVTGSTLMKN
jgi:hypothetical protein